MIIDKNVPLAVISGSIITTLVTFGATRLAEVLLNSFGFWLRIPLIYQINGEINGLTSGLACIGYILSGTIIGFAVKKSLVTVAFLSGAIPAGVFVLRNIIPNASVGYYVYLSRVFLLVIILVCIGGFIGSNLRKMVESRKDIKPTKRP